MLPGRLQDVHGALDVDLEIAFRLLYGGDYVGKPRQMKYPVNSLETWRKSLFLANIHLVQGDVAVVDEIGQIVRPAGGKIIHHPHRMTKGKQGFTKMAANKSGAAGYQGNHDIRFALP